MAAAVSTSLSMKTSRPIPFAFDRKEEKSHGEGGNIVGEVKDKKVLILDDVLTAGTALKQSMEIISNAGGKITGCMVALDREEIFDQITARIKSLKSLISKLLLLPEYLNLLIFLIYLVVKTKLK